MFLPPAGEVTHTNFILQVSVEGLEVVNYLTFFLRLELLYDVSISFCTPVSRTEHDAPRNDDASVIIRIMQQFLG